MIIQSQGCQFVTYHKIACATSMGSAGGVKICVINLGNMTNMAETPIYDKQNFFSRTIKMPDIET